MGKQKRKDKGRNNDLPMIQAVFDPGDKIGFVYSYDNPHQTHRVFIARDVPRSKVDYLCATMHFLSSRTIIEDGQTVMSNGFHFLTRVVEGTEKMELLETHVTTNTRPNMPLFELIPRFDSSDNPNEWGFKPSAPDGQDDLADSIIDVWIKENIYFLHHVDGNVGNNSILNLKRVDLAIALHHINDWKVDWYSHLTSHQLDFVLENSKYFEKIAKVLFRNKKEPFCGQCGAVAPARNLNLKKCSKCKEVFYCCVEHQKQDWPIHKKRCMDMVEKRKKKPVPVE